MPAATRPPISSVPLFVRCRWCDEVFRASGSFLGPTPAVCVWCGHTMRLVPRAA